MKMVTQHQTEDINRWMQVTITHNGWQNIHNYISIYLYV